MAYFTTEELQDAGHIPMGGDIYDLVAAPQNNGLGFSITDVLGGIGTAVGSIFGGGKSGSSDAGSQAQIAAMIAAQQRAQAESNKTLLLIGGGLAVLVLFLSYSKRGKR